MFEEILTHRPAAADDGRLAFVDTARAVAACAVMAGSILPSSHWSAAAVAAAGFPLSAWVSGFLWPGRRFRVPLRVSIADLARGLLVPYAMLFGACWLVWIGVHGLTDGRSWFDPRDAMMPVAGFVYGGGVLDRVNPVLWALPCLFVAIAVYLVLHRALGPLRATATKMLDDGGTAMLVAVLSLLLLAAQPRLVPAMPGWWPWGIALAPVLLACFAAGQWSRRWRVGHDGAASSYGRNARSAAVLVPLALAAWVGAAWVGAPADFTHRHVSAQPVAFAVAALAAAACVARVAVWLPASRAARWLADHALGVTVLQALLAVSLRGLLPLLQGPDPGQALLSGFALDLLLGAVAVALAVAIVAAWQRLAHGAPDDDEEAASAARAREARPGGDGLDPSPPFEGGLAGRWARGPRWPGRGHDDVVDDALSRPAARPAGDARPD